MELPSKVDPEVVKRLRVAEDMEVFIDELSSIAKRNVAQIQTIVQRAAALRSAFAFELDARLKSEPETTDDKTPDPNSTVASLFKDIHNFTSLLLQLAPLIKDDVLATYNINTKSFTTWEDNHGKIWLGLVRLYEDEPFHSLVKHHGWQNELQDAAIYDEWIWIGRLERIVDGLPIMPLFKPKPTLKRMIIFGSKAKKPTTVAVTPLTSPEVVRAVREVTSQKEQFYARDWSARRAVVFSLMTAAHLQQEKDAGHAPDEAAEKLLIRSLEEVRDALQTPSVGALDHTKSLNALWPSPLFKDLASAHDGAATSPPGQLTTNRFQGELPGLLLDGETGDEWVDESTLFEGDDFRFSMPARWVYDGESHPVALSWARRAGKKRDELLPIVVAAKRFWAVAHHPNIVSLLGFRLLPRDTVIVTPRCDGTLMDYFKSRPQLGRDAKLEMLIGIADALVYLHDLDPAAVHGGVMDQNILVVDTKPKITHTGLYCQEHWAAPEVAELSTKIGQASDVWSFGAYILQLMSGHLPFYKMKLVYRRAAALHSGEMPGREDHKALPAADPLWNLIEAALLSKPDERIKMRDLRDQLKELKVGEGTV